MPASIKGGGAPAVSYEKIAKSLEKSAEGLKESARGLQKSGILRGADAFAEVANAGADALSSTSRLAEGVAEALTAGADGWQSADVQPGAKFVSKNAARGIGTMASSLPRVVGEGKLTTTREIQADPNALVFSEAMFGKAAKALQKSADAMLLSWAAYGEAIAKMIAQPAEAEAAAVHVASVAGNLAKAAALTTSSATVKMAEYGVKLTDAAVEAAEDGTPGSGELTQLSVSFLATTAGVLVGADAGGKLAAFQQELSELQRRNPALSAHLDGL